MGLTIGAILVSYDINKLHSEVKNVMIKMGYYENWRYGQGKVYQMPNTTLWHENKSSDQAISDLKGVCYSLNVTLEKAVAVKATEFVGV